MYDFDHALIILYIKCSTNLQIINIVSEFFVDLILGETTKVGFSQTLRSVWSQKCRKKIISQIGDCCLSACLIFSACMNARHSYMIVIWCIISIS